jgi:hypothetical protein
MCGRYASYLPQSALPARFVKTVEEVPVILGTEPGRLTMYVEFERLWRQLDRFVQRITRRVGSTELTEGSGQPPVRSGKLGVVEDRALRHLHRCTVISLEIVADGQGQQYDPIRGTTRAEP